MKLKSAYLMLAVFGESEAGDGVSLARLAFIFKKGGSCPRATETRKGRK